MKILRVLLLLVSTVILMNWSSCSVKRHQISGHEFRTASELAQWLFDTAGVHSGLLVVEADPGSTSQDPIIDYHSQSLFTPASNTKLLTLFASLKFLPDRLTGMRYTVHDGTTYFKGTGDPGFLDPRFPSEEALAFLNQQQKLVFISDWDSDRRWGSGWSWDDYPYYYSGQLSPLPIYGNMVRAWCEEGQWNLFPGTFIHNRVNRSDYYRVKRHEQVNIFQLNAARCVEDTLRIPFVWNHRVATGLLADTLHQMVDWAAALPDDIDPQWNSVPGSARDTLLRAMMYDSDNLIAEQMMMSISAHLWDTIDMSRAIDTVVKSEFGEWENQIRWVDGSGLSIYNKFSPRFLVHLLQRLHASMPLDELLTFFPAGGLRGTIQSWYGNGNQPYVFAKTGTLSAVHCLSGFLKADSGKTYIFSFMHNNYLGSSSIYKEKMQILLEFLKTNY